MNNDKQQPDKITTPKTFARKMRRILNESNKYNDPEASHLDADKLLCRILNELGYQKGIELYDEIGKWYA